jgi:chemotaxis methyl-accepting protein methylase
VRVRAVEVEPAVVAAVTPRDVNVVLERLDPLQADEQFDLIIATNVLLYYDRFEQGLALTNIGKMLRPGAFFLTNYSITPIEPFDKSPALVTQVIWDHAGAAQRAPKAGDTVYAFRRRP